MCGNFHALMKEVIALSRLVIALGVSIFFGVNAFAVNSSSLTADEIVSKAVSQVHASASSPLPTYSFTAVTTREERNAEGEVKERKHEQDEILFERGAYKKLNCNGRESVSSPEADLLRLNKSNSNKRSDYLNLLTPELVGKFVYTFVQRTNINGRTAFELAFRPRAVSKPAKDFRDRLLNNAVGKLWVDSEEFELVKAQINIDSEVPVGSGIFGALKKAAFTLERVRLETGVWFERTFRTDYEARKFAEVKRVVTLGEFRDFRRLDTEG